MVRGIPSGAGPGETAHILKCSNISTLDKIDPEYCTNFKEALQSDFGQRVLEILVPGAHKHLIITASDKFITAHQRDEFIKFLQESEANKDFLQRALDKLQGVILNNSNAEFINSLMIDNKFSAEAVIAQFITFLKNYPYISTLETERVFTLSQSTYAYKNEEGKYVVVNKNSDNSENKYPVLFTKLTPLLGNHFVGSTEYQDDDDMIDGDHYIFSKNGEMIGKITGIFHDGFSIMDSRYDTIIALFGDDTKYARYYKLTDNNIQLLNTLALPHEEFKNIFNTGILHTKNGLFILAENNQIKKVSGVHGTGFSRFESREGNLSQTMITIHGVDYIFQDGSLYTPKKGYKINNFKLYKGKNFFSKTLLVDFYCGFAEDIDYSWSQENLDKYFDVVETTDV